MNLECNQTISLPPLYNVITVEPVYNGHHVKWLLYRGGLFIEVIVYNGHPWDHAEWLLYRGGLLIEVGGALGLYYVVDGLWDLSYWLAYRE